MRANLSDVVWRSKSLEPWKTLHPWTPHYHDALPRRPTTTPYHDALPWCTTVFHRIVSPELLSDVIKTFVSVIWSLVSLYVTHPDVFLFQQVSFALTHNRYTLGRNHYYTYGKAIFEGNFVIRGPPPSPVPPPSWGISYIRGIQWA